MVSEKSVQKATSHSRVRRILPPDPMSAVNVKSHSAVPPFQAFPAHLPLYFQPASVPSHSASSLSRRLQKSTWCVQNLLGCYGFFMLDLMYCRKNNLQLCYWNPFPVSTGWKDFLLAWIRCMDSAHQQVWASTTTNPRGLIRCANPRTCHHFCCQMEPTSCWWTLIRMTFGWFPFCCVPGRWPRSRLLGSLKCDGRRRCWGGGLEHLP